jgi:DNA-binding CsgD family transcriptional regulator
LGVSHGRPVDPISPCLHKSTKEVATKLGLTVRTIESYRNDLIKKDELQNTAELISVA